MNSPVPTDPVIRLTEVNKHYGNFHALRDVSLEVAKGEKIIICGPSGSGKSTLIRCINRIERHDSGEIMIDGPRLTGGTKDVAAIRREVGMVFQSFNLFPHMTILENCTIAPRKSRGLGKAEAEEPPCIT